MEYILGLKNEIRLLNEEEAKERYLELLAKGNSERDIILAAPVSEQVHLNIGQQMVAGTEVGLNNNVPGDTQYSNVSGLNFGGDKLPSETLS